MCNIEPVYLKSALEQCKVHTRKNPFMHKLEGWEMWVTGHLKTLEFRFVVKKNSWKRSPRLFIRIIEAQTGSNTLCDKKYNTPYDGRLFFPMWISTWEIVGLLFSYFFEISIITDLLQKNVYFAKDTWGINLCLENRIVVWIIKLIIKFAPPVIQSVFSWNIPPLYIEYDVVRF